VNMENCCDDGLFISEIVLFTTIEDFAQYFDRPFTKCHVNGV